MTGSSPRLVGVVVFLVAAAVGVLITSLVVGGFGGSATPSPSAVAQASASPAAPSRPRHPRRPAPPRRPRPRRRPRRPASPRRPRPRPTKPTTAPGVPSAISFSSLKLDAADDPAGKNRVITFERVGAGHGLGGPVVGLAPGRDEDVPALDEEGLRLQDDGQRLDLGAHRGQAADLHPAPCAASGSRRPQVDVALTFPQRRPAVTIAHARFDGTASPDTNGIDATFAPHADGKAHIVAEWGGHPFLYELTLKEQGGPGVHAKIDQGAGDGRRHAARRDRAEPVAPRPLERGGGFRRHADDRHDRLAVAAHGTIGGAGTGPPTHGARRRPSARLGAIPAVIGVLACAGRQGRCSAARHAHRHVDPSEPSPRPRCSSRCCSASRRRRPPPSSRRARCPAIARSSSPRPTSTR